MKKRNVTETKNQRLHELLGALGSGQISVDQFRKYMSQYGFVDSDIDDYCRASVWIPVR